MALRLKIVSRHQDSLADRRIKEFGQAGGRIGRSIDNDWVLPDGQRYVSSRHASIDFRSGSYYIVDTSTNGVYVNGSDTPVGRGKPQRLFDGDRIRIGEYEMTVEVDDETCVGHLIDENHVDPVDRAQRVEAPDPTGADMVDAFEITGVGMEMQLTDDEIETLTPPSQRGRRVLEIKDDDSDGMARTKPFLGQSAPVAATPRSAGPRAAPPSIARPARGARQPIAQRPAATEPPAPSASHAAGHASRTGGTSGAPIAQGGSSGARGAGAARGWSGATADAPAGRGTAGGAAETDASSVDLSLSLRALSLATGANEIPVRPESTPSLTTAGSATADGAGAPPAPSKARPAAAAPAPAASRATTRAAAPSSRASASASEQASGRASPEAHQPTDAGVTGGQATKALEPFFRGAGIKSQRIDEQQADAILLCLGQIMREMIVGVSEILHQRAEQKNALRLPNTTIQPQNNNPLKFSAGVEETLLNLLLRDSQQYLLPVEAIREAFGDIKLHQQVLLKALRAAVDGFIERLDPDDLEEKFSSGRSGMLINAANKLKYWDLYKDMYQVVAHHPPGELPMQFLEDFAQAYERETAGGAPAGTSRTAASARTG